MKKIRLGNDFVFLWAIERGGVAEDFTGVLDAKITASVFGNKKDIPFTISGNIVRIEFTPVLCNTTGVYNLELSYTLPDETLSDDDRKCVVDVDAFQIVPRSYQADDPSELSVTSDMAIAFQGKSAYGVWLETHEGTEEDYISFLRQPAIDAAATANAAAELANTAAELADDARLAIQDDLAMKADHGYDTTPKTLKEVDDSVLSDEEVVAADLNTLAERINALEEAFRNSVFNKVQTDTLDVLVNLNFQGRPLIIVSNVAPSVAPDGVPQFYINTATGDFYSAKASGSAGDWILI